LYSWPLKFGAFLAPFHALDENPTAALERDMELLQYLDALGFHEAWIGEHHSGGFEIISCPEMFIAAAAERTRRIRLGTGVVSLPYHNPFTLAGRMVQLDHMTKGRAMFGVGPGSLSSDAFAQAIRPADQRPRMMQGIEAVTRLLRGEVVTMKTDWFELQEARLHMPNFTHPHIEMVVAAARSPVGSRAAGTFGLGMLQLTGTSPDSMAALAASWAACTDEAERHRQIVDRRNWRLVLQVHVAETREQAFSNVEFGLERFVQYFRDVGTFQIVPDGVPASASYMVEKNIALIGTPDDVVEQIEKLWDSTGGFGSYLVLAHNWADWNATKRNYELLARHVIPRINSMNVSRQASYDYVKVNHARFLEEATAAVQAETDRYARDKATRSAEIKA
jgi:limonene 1,2-monooxygenase